MNEQVEKTITNSLDGFQWVLFAMLIVLFLYLLVSKRKKE